MLQLWRESDAVERALIVLFLVIGGPVAIVVGLYCLGAAIDVSGRGGGHPRVLMTSWRSPASRALSGRCTAPFQTVPFASYGTGLLVVLH